MQFPFAAFAALVVAGAGSSLTVAQVQPPDPAVTGRWRAPIPSPAIGIHSVLLHDGQVLLYSYNLTGGPGSTTYTFDPVSGQFTEYLLDKEVFCGGNTFLPDGRVFMSSNYLTEKIAYSFDTVNGWVKLPDMISGRFYASNITMANGGIFTLTGTTRKIEVYTDGVGWHELPPSADCYYHFYPRLFVIPEGGLFVCGPFPKGDVFDPETKSWRPIANSSEYRFEGTAVQLPPEPGVRYLVCGGNDTGTTSATAEVIDLSAVTPGWQNVGNMRRARHDHNATILPDGTVLATGGTRFTASGHDVAVNEAELFDPVAGTWTLLPATIDPREYHSTAVLLPDGSVLAAGGDGVYTLEIYEPSYFFRGPRPRTWHVPADVTYRERFTIDCDQALDIERVVLIAPGAATHSFNATQRYLELEFEHEPTDKGRTRLAVKAPKGSGFAPPFYYMLFVVNRDGIPSQAKFVLVH